MAKLPAGCRKLNNFCNALVRITRTLPLAAKSCDLFSSSAAKDFFAVTLRQPYSKLAAEFSFSKLTSLVNDVTHGVRWCYIVFTL